MTATDNSETREAGYCRSVVIGSQIERASSPNRERISAVGAAKPGKNVVKFILTNDGDKIALELDGSKSATESFDLVIENMTDREISTSSGGDLWKMTIEPDKKRVSRY